MSREYCFNVTVPLEDLAVVDELLREARQNWPFMRISRKPDRNECARFYLSFPVHAGRPDVAFQEWWVAGQKKGWDLYGPVHGRWGLA